MAAERTVFFVFGIPKSGTTWLQMLLDAHPQAVCRPEDQFGFFVKSFDLLLNRYNKMLTGIAERTAGIEAEPFDSRDGAMMLRNVVRLALSKGFRHEGVRASGIKDNGIVDRIGLFYQLFPQGRFIYLLRDPRDVAVSSWFHNRRVESDTSRHASNLVDWTRLIASTWANATESVTVSAEARKVALLPVRYEDLVGRKAEQAVARVLEFIEVDASSAVARDCLAATRFERLAGGRKRGQEDRGSFWRKGQPGDWRNHLDNTAITVAAEAAGTIMARYGYDAGG